MSNDVIILGKPNVGKSSIFNIMIGKNIALVDGQPGVTRDIRVKRIDFQDTSFNIIDSPGLTKATSKLEYKIRENTLKKIKKCKLFLLVVDGRLPLSFEDYDLINFLRKFDQKKILIINKTESKVDNSTVNECLKVGFKELLKTSAAHNIGIQTLKEIICKELESSESIQSIKNELSVAIVGKTNSGKSTLLNILKGEKISLTDNQPNITRDFVEAEISSKIINFKAFDTAGFSKNVKKISKLEKLSLKQTYKKIRLCKFVLIVIDVDDYYERLHSKIINLVVEEKRCLLILVNKIDKKKINQAEIKSRLYSLNPQIKNLPIFFISALKNIGIKALLKGISMQFKIWNVRYRTNQLNNWLKKTLNNHPHPMHRGKEIKLKYISQVNTAPPKFTIFSNYPEKVKESYQRYLLNNLKKDFKMNGLPVKLIIKKSNNPYDKN